MQGVMKEWEEWMDARPDEVKRSGQGKMAAATQMSSALNLKPLFRQLRSRVSVMGTLRVLANPSSVPRYR
jgi:pre-mRNA-splicing factor 18